MKKLLSILTVLLFVFAFSENFVKAAGAPILAVAITSEAGTDGSVVGTFAQQPSVTVTDTANGNVVVPGATVTITVIDGTDESLTGTRTCTSGADGTCTFADLAYTKTDQFQLRYTATLYGATTGSADGAAITLVAGAPHTLTIGRQPANVDGLTTAVIQTQPIVNATDQYGNNCQNGVNIVAAKNTGTGTLRGTTTVAIAGGAGNATFTDLGYSKSGEVFKLSFTASTGDAAAVVSNNITALAPGLKNKLSLTAEPTVGYTYVDFATQPVVEFQDTYGNKTADTSTVTIAAYSDATCDTALEADFTGTKAKAAVAGTATFTSISYDTVRVAGLYLGATADGVTKDCSALFKVYGNTSTGGGGGSSSSSSTTATTTTTVPTTVTTVPATTTTTTAFQGKMPIASKSISTMTQAEKNSFVMELQTFLIQLLTQLLTMLKK